MNFFVPPHHKQDCPEGFAATDSAAPTSSSLIPVRGGYVEPALVSGSRDSRHEVDEC